MLIPSQLKIGGHRYTIQIVPELDGKYGLHDGGKGMILLDSSITRSRMESTLFHEIIHAINSELDHALLDSLAEQLYQVLADNDMLAEPLDNPAPS